MIRLKPSDIIIVSGERGTGKSTLAKYLASMFPRYVVWDPLAEYQEDGFENVVIPRTADPDEFELFCSKIWELGNIMIVIDEAESVMPEGRNLTPNCFKILMQGRHKNIGMIATTKRIAELKKSVVSQAKYVILFRHFLKNDIDYIRTFAGDKAYELKDLKDYRFMVYSLGEFSGPYKVDLDKCFDGGMNKMNSGGLQNENIV